jgi:hypothetical protein
MSLYPGGRIRNAATGALEPSVDVAAQANSLALTIEDEFNILLSTVRHLSVPEEMKKDCRILFTAISRGVLRYLSEHENGNIKTVPPTGIPSRPVTLSVNLNEKTPP